MKKRGAIEVQFNWLFVLIVGAMILIFFTTAIMRQKDISEAKIAATILTDLETITTGAKVSRSTFQVISVPDTNIKFSCDDCLCKFSIGDNSKPFRDKVIFAPEYIKGRQVLAWTQEFSMPFRVSNLLYLTSPQLRYIIRDNNGNNLLANLIDESLPDEILHERNPGIIEDNNHYKVKFIYIDMGPDDTDLEYISKMKDSDVTAINVLTATNQITFYGKDSSNWAPEGSNTFWVASTREDLLGAIFAEDLEMYNCQMREIFNRMKIASRIYESKTTNLKAYFQEVYSGSQRDCEVYYTPALASLAALYGISQAQANNFPTGINLNELSGISIGLNTENNNIMIKHCPEIY